MLSSDSKFAPSGFDELSSELPLSSPDDGELDSAEDSDRLLSIVLIKFKSAIEQVAWGFGVLGFWGLGFRV